MWPYRPLALQTAHHWTPLVARIFRSSGIIFHRTPQARIFRSYDIIFLRTPQARIFRSSGIIIRTLQTRTLGLLRHRPFRTPPQEPV